MESTRNDLTTGDERSTANDAGAIVHRAGERSGASLSDFDAILGNSAGAQAPDAAAPREAGPSSAADPAALDAARAIPFDFSDRPQQSKPKAGPLDWASFVLAVVLPPVGLVLSVVVRIVSYSRRGWTSGVARAATVVGVVFTLVAGGAAFTLNTIAEEEAAEAARVAASVPLCSALAETPGVLEAPAFGWPVDVAALPATLELMKAYQLRWSELAAIAPSDQTSAVRSISVAAQTLVSSVETTKSIDRQRNLEQMTAITTQSGLIDWYSQYCS